MTAERLRSGGYFAKIFFTSAGYFSDSIDPHHYLSTSPRTMSTEPMMATRSATSTPFACGGMDPRLSKEGVRQWIRYGLAPPSDSRKTPSSPRGDSAAA